jgi:ribose 5-phosphate isomerase B
LYYLDKTIAQDGKNADLAKRVRWQVAIASAKIAYQIYKEIFGGERYKKLADKGARAQRLLWASTGTKNPAYFDAVGGNIMRVGIAADHGGYELKERLVTDLKTVGHEVVDFGASELISEDDYPEYIVPLARAVASGEVARGLAVCGSGVGACVAANKVRGARAALITDPFSAHQGVEDDDMNVMCLGGRVTGHALSWDLVQIFLRARFKGDERFQRRLAQVAALENASKTSTSNSQTRQRQ